MSDSWSYSVFGEPSAYRAYYRWDNTTRYQGTYTRNKVGQITKNVEIANGVTTTWDYTYNNIGWLTAVKKNGAAFQSYVYDANGNRTSIVAGGVTTAPAYDPQHRLTVFGNTAYTYNNAGDLVSSSVGTAKKDFTYDIYGNLLSVKKPSGTTITYIYNVDPLRRRIRKSVNGTMVQGLLWADALHPVAEIDAAGKVAATFTYAEKGNVPSIMSKGGTDYRIISDHLGSVRMVVNNNSGAVLQQLDYDPYGRVVADTNPGFQPFGYAGGLSDRDTGLVRFGRRDYDPVVGRWTSKDPIGFAGGLNLYGYVVQDPVNLVDPDGEHPAIIVLAILAYEVTHPTPVDQPWTVADELEHDLNAAIFAKSVVGVYNVYKYGKEYSIGKDVTYIPHFVRGEIHAEIAYLFLGISSRARISNCSGDSSGAKVLSSFFFLNS